MAATLVSKKDAVLEAFPQKSRMGDRSARLWLNKFSRGGSQQAEELSDRVMRFERMAEPKLRLDAIGVAASLLFDDEIAGFNELPDDLLNHPLCDPDHQGDFSQANLGVTVDAQQDVGVVGEEGPRWDRA